jgi:rhodanese-related sulfurtransferase
MKCTHTIAGMLAIVGLGYFAGIGHSLWRSEPIVLRLTSVPIDTDTEPPETDPAAQQSPDEQLDPLDIPGPSGTLTLREAFALYEDGAYFIDARNEDEYTESHIAYALFIPAQRVRTRAGLDELSTIPPDVTVVIYCVGGECDASENALLAIRSANFGFKDIRIMGRGFKDWADAGLPVEHADGTITGESP